MLRRSIAGIGRKLYATRIIVRRNEFLSGRDPSCPPAERIGHFLSTFWGVAGLIRIHSPITMAAT
jgi:hypothetical protein